MRERTDKGQGLAYFLIGCWAVFTGCDSKPAAPGQVQAPAKQQVAQPFSTERVGDYLIGQSTLREVLGEDTPEARKKLTARGLNCEFDQGGTLTAVTISSADYVLSNGLSVGSRAAEVRAKLGAPRETSVQSDKLQFNALVYDRLAFLLDDAETVFAIRVSK